MSATRAYVIEPQTVFVPYLKKMLERAGFDVVESRRDVDPKAIDAAHPGVVFVDVDFFERRGMTALCRIREAFASGDSQPAVVAYTVSSGDPTHRASCYISGATIVCSKDATEDEIIAELRAVALTGHGDGNAVLRRPKSVRGA